MVKTLSKNLTAVPLGNPISMAVPQLRRLLSKKGIKPLTGDVVLMASSLLSNAEKGCPLFKGGISKGFGHLCIPHADCMGVRCGVSVLAGPKVTKVPMDLWVNTCKMEAELNVGGVNSRMEFDARDHEIHVHGVDIGNLELSMVFNADKRGTEVLVSVEAKLCFTEMLSCLPTIDVLTDIRISVANQSCKRAPEANTTETEISLDAMTVPEFVNTLSDYELLDPKMIEVLDRMRSTAISELLSEKEDPFSVGGKEFQDKIDFCVSANIPVPPYDITFFSFRSLFMVGPVPLSLGFGAGGSVGLSITVGFCVLSMKATITVTPWVGGKVWGDAALDIGIARGGIRLIGYLMETRFPITGELGFAKFPLDVGAKMDLLLTPVRLDLKAFAELNLFIKTVTVFDASIWKYKAPTIKWNIFDKHTKNEDKSPPDIMPLTVNKRRRREGTRGCVVKQIPGRRPDDAAFMLEVYAQDEVSDTKLSYAIGTNRGGSDVVSWTEMGGATLLVPTKLPGGIPLYWTVKAKNSQGLEATTQCSLNTYDSTIPDGRVEHSYQCSSHPSKLTATIIVFEDSALVDTHYKSVGYSAGKFGSEFVGWEPISLDHTTFRTGELSSLKYFAVAREGKLVAPVLKSSKLESDKDCAQMCINHGSNCVSFDYEYHSETCDLHNVVEGANAFLRKSGTFKNYERLGTGYQTYIEYNSLLLSQGTRYYINANITNVLGYRSYLVGEGTMIDFTPPEPGDVGNASMDVRNTTGCGVAVTQQCIDVTGKVKHRTIVDGPTGKTVFNGHKPLEEQRYTLTNHYATANWNGFHDDECGIWGYTWAVGRRISAADVVSFRDPHAHLSSKKFWTNSGFAKELHLEDGEYFVTVQALNGAQLGGSLVTTVAHSTPFIVDTTPPVFSGVTDIIYDEDFDLLAVYYNASDELSKIARADFGLGKTKYDVELRSYSQHSSMERIDPFVAIEELGLPPGIPAWIRIRVLNNVDLFTTGHGNEPIMIDKTAPIPGKVLDGSRLRQDVRYQADTKQLCAQWVDFYDPESGIDHFVWGIGTKPGKDDIKKFHNYTHYHKTGCSPVHLQHNCTYYSTVYAYNMALNSKSTNNTSDGVLIDTTCPLAGVVKDGSYNTSEEEFSSESAAKASNWHGFFDPESGIEKYEVDVLINSELKQTFTTDGGTTDFTDHSISMEHKDHVSFIIHAYNGAELRNTSASNGFLVDHTAPTLKMLQDTTGGSRYQNFADRLDLKWDFTDPESGIKEYRTIVFETKEGVKHKYWPTSAYNKTMLTSSYITNTVVVLDGLSLANGALYTVKVTALNQALMSTSHESRGVIVDTIPPKVTKVHIGLMENEEELDDDEKTVLHADQNGIRVSWKGRDPESGISKYYVAVGVKEGDTSITNRFLDFGTQTTAYIDNIYLETTESSGTYYVVTVQAVNGAGSKSAMQSSKRIKVLKANVPGIVFDGRELFEDLKYTRDHTSLAMSFYGFESESCNIVGYEWAIGTEPFGSNVLPFTDYGLVMKNQTHGYAQIHIQLYTQTLYHSTVRAKTGHNCQDEFIVSTSDGIIVDNTPPEIFFNKADDNQTGVIKDDVMYQSLTDAIVLQGNASDTSSIKSVQWAVSPLPLHDPSSYFTSDIDSLVEGISLLPGHAIFMNVKAIDDAGNMNISTSLPITPDITSPVLSDLRCTKFVSTGRSLFKCSWSAVKEYESSLDSILVSIGTRSKADDIMAPTAVPKHRQYFTRDLIAFVRDIKTTQKIYVDFLVKNILGLKTDLERVIVVDTTGPKGKINVVTSTSEKIENDHQACQLPQTYAEIRIYDVLDGESGVDHQSFEVALGTRKGGTNIHGFTKGHQIKGDIILINGFEVPPATIMYATARVYNKAGLFTLLHSQKVVVSPSPSLKVVDGSESEDLDYQSQPNILQGQWRYSDKCPIVKAEWAVEDLLGHVVKDFQQISVASRKFYNDEMQLHNGFMYINIIKVTDQLMRTKISRSDGITVRIQPPYPGHVRDGEDVDLNYQFSVTELHANWDEFGDTSDDPTQRIKFYVVAVGNDRRYEKTRSNIHSFVNVGKNTSYTFSHLNLTAKLVKYYITVRAYSEAGSYVEGYSNGVNVGYRDDILPGEIKAKRFQASDVEITFSWSDFISDIGIVLYKVGVSTTAPMANNDTFECSLLDESAFDMHPLSSVGLNQYVNVKHLSLEHNGTYFATVIGEDESGMCALSFSEAILVDTTTPEDGDILINGIQSSSVLFATSESEMQVSWTGFQDPESGIRKYVLSLYSCLSCIIPNNDVNHDCFIVQETDVMREMHTGFYDLELTPDNVYLIRIRAYNFAGGYRSSYSTKILIDTTAPLTGDVKIGKDWDTIRSFQKSTEEISGLLAIATSKEDYFCLNEETSFPDTENHFNWQVPLDDFHREYLKQTESQATLGIGYNVERTEMIRTGLETKFVNLRAGKYKLMAKAAEGDHIITTFAVASSRNVVPTIIGDMPIESKFDMSLFHNISGLEKSNKTYVTETNDIEVSTMSLSPLTTEFVTNKRQSNQSSVETKANLLVNEFGFGINLYGFKHKSNKVWYHKFWAQDHYKASEQWFTTAKDPSQSKIYYTFIVKKAKVGDEFIWDLSLSVENQELSTISGLRFRNDVQLSFFTWNEDHFSPEITDWTKPFYSEAQLYSVHLPGVSDRKCLHGRGIFDAESGIKQILVGVSNDLHNPGNIKPLEISDTFCFPCTGPCSHVCHDHCDDQKLETSYTIIPILVQNLSLSPTDVDVEFSNTTGIYHDNASVYYINVKAVNFAGKETLLNSNPVRIDTTPPRCGKMNCLDPDYSIDEPTEHLGSSSNIGAYWNCSEDVSEIEAYMVTVLRDHDNDIIVNLTDVGLKTKLVLNLQNGTFEDGEKYTMIVYAINSAGLETESKCTVEVGLRPPDISDTGSKPLYLATEVQQDLNHRAAFTNEQDKTGINWQGGKRDTEFYEWKIGTRKGEDDIFPQVKVGITGNGSAEILAGKLTVNNMPLNKSIAEFQSVGNWTNDTIANVKSDSSFLMEPGRCLHHTLQAKGWSHLTSDIPVAPSCIVRSKDIKVNPKQDFVFLSKFMTAHNWTSNETIDQNRHGVTISAKVANGSIIAGSLETDDLNKIYGSAASSRFKPFVVDPDSTLQRTSRILRDRIMNVCGESFFIAPAPIVHIETLLVNSTLSKACQPDQNTIPALLYWNFDKDMWVHVLEHRTSNLMPWVKDGIYSVEVWSGERNTDDTRTKRSTNGTHTPVRVTNPRHYLMVRAKRQFVNAQPIITTDTLDAMEDTGIPCNVTIRYTDKENDTLIFKVIEQTKFGTVNITYNNTVCYNPLPDFYGHDLFKIRGSEIGIPIGEIANDVEKTIDITVHMVNDKPQMVFLDHHGQTHEKNPRTIDLSMKFDANTSTDVFLGTIVAFDVDDKEVFIRNENFTIHENITFTLKEVDITTVTNLTFDSNSFATTLALQLTLHSPLHFNGKLVYMFALHDDENLWGPQLNVQTHILINPCVKGTCVPKISGRQGCDDVRRELSFDPFYCTCYPGYKGEWCQEEINECKPEPCALMFDCEDRVNGYRCNINVGKLFAILFCSIAAIGVVVFFSRRFVKKAKQNKIGQSVESLLSASRCENLVKTADPLTSRAIYPKDYRPATPEPDDREDGDSYLDEDSGRTTEDTRVKTPLSLLSQHPGQALPPHHRLSKFKTTPPQRQVSSDIKNEEGDRVTGNNWNMALQMADRSDITEVEI